MWQWYSIFALINLSLNAIHYPCKLARLLQIIESINRSQCRIKGFRISITYIGDSYIVLIYYLLTGRLYCDSEACCLQCSKSDIYTAMTTVFCAFQSRLYRITFVIYQNSFTYCCFITSVVWGWSRGVGKNASRLLNVT